MAAGATNNVVLRTSVFDRVRPWFDEALSDVGGSDHEFLRRVADAGLGIRWTTSAVVHEDVPADRLTLGWLTRRALRTGSVEAVVAVRRGDARTGIALRSVLRLAANVLRTPLALRDRAWLGRCLFGICHAIGTLLGLVGVVVPSYGVHDVPGVRPDQPAGDP